MAAKNVVGKKVYLTQSQIEAIAALHTGNMSELIRQLLKSHVEVNGGEWPSHPATGKHGNHKRKQAIKPEKE